MNFVLMILQNKIFKNNEKIKRENINKDINKNQKKNYV